MKFASKILIRLLWTFSCLLHVNSLVLLWRANVLQSLAPTPIEPANQGLTRKTRNFQACVLWQVGAKLCRTVDWVWTSLVYMLLLL